jgi:hypothetical protein
MTRSSILQNYRTIAALLLMAALAACSSSGNHRPGMIQPVSNRAQFDDAVALLVDGNLKSARKLLATMAKRDPSDLRTTALIASLDADPVKTLGKLSFGYRIQPGDHMTTLSQRFLGDRLKFYILSRYNGISVPKSIVPGQLLRIPGVAPPPPPPPPRVIQGEPLRPPVVAPVEPKAPPPRVVVPTTPAVNHQRALQLRGAGLAALNAGKVNNAVAMLRRAAALDPASAVIRTDLTRAIRIQATVAARR